MRKSMRLLRGVVALAVVFLGSIASQAEEDFTVVQLCDTQLGMGGYEHDVDSFTKAVVQINALAPDMVFICGDLVNTASDESFNDFKAINAKFTIPSYPASGNHDVENEPTAESLAKYRSAIGEDFYTVEHKRYTFIIVNTQLWKVEVAEESAKHHAWFIKTLKEAHAKGSKSIIVGHYPIFVNTADEPDEYFNLPMPLRQELLTLCVEEGVVAYFAGHVHKNLEREYKGIPMIASASSSRNFDGAPMGFRLWVLTEDGPKSHEYIAIEGLDPALVPDEK